MQPVNPVSLEHARKGIMAALAGKMLRRPHEGLISEARRRIGRSTLINLLTQGHPWHLYHEGEVLCDRHTANPYHCGAPAIEQALREMTRHKLLTKHHSRVGRLHTHDTVQATSYSITPKGLTFIDSYDHAMAQKLVQALGWELSESDAGKPITEDATGVMRMARLYAETMFSPDGKKGNPRER